MAILYSGMRLHSNKALSGAQEAPLAEPEPTAGVSEEQLQTPGPPATIVKQLFEHKGRVKRNNAARSRRDLKVESVATMLHRRGAANRGSWCVVVSFTGSHCIKNSLT